MKVVDALEFKNRKIACCLGQDITFDLSCKRIEVDGVEFGVMDKWVSKSFCGTMNAFLQLDVNELSEIPRGDVTIVR